MPFHTDEATALSASQPSKVFSFADRTVLHRAAGMPSHFAYYCSGHGFGHATRVIAVTQELLVQGHSVSIVTNAPERIFTSVIQAGATYRNADIDAGICQPKAYDVDRRKTIDGLRAFLARREDKIAAEVQWLRQTHVHAVISDAPFLPCAAAAQAGIPSCILSNFSFDSCYSYLSAPTPANHSNDEPDVPLHPAELDPLVEQVVSDYKNASLLLRLPGIIPFPAFDSEVPMPAPRWVDDHQKDFTPQVANVLSRPSRPIKSPSGSTRQVIDVPLVSRLPSPASHRPGFRESFLLSLGVPAHQTDASQTKVLLVSFGGQNIPRPGSRPSSPGPSVRPPFSPARSINGGKVSNTDIPPSTLKPKQPPPPQRLATEEHLYLPGAPAALTHSSSRSKDLSQFAACSSDQNGKLTAELLPESNAQLVPNDGLLPAGWIALVCGLKAEDRREPLPEGFYGCPSDVYVPDLCAVADALLGKLGYGACSEAISAQLPFIFVPRPMFVEEFGLKRLTKAHNTLVEMDRASFEEGQWAPFVESAYHQHQKRKLMPPTIDTEELKSAGRVIVGHLEHWLESSKSAA